MRPTWDELFIKIAEDVAEKSSCSRIKVGSVLVKDQRIISMGYNGSFPGSEHCEDHWKNHCVDNDISYSEFLQSEEFKSLHHEWATKNEIHSEQNLIAYAAKNGISPKESTLYITYSPCIHCAKLISQAGINEVKYLNQYDRDQEGIKFLEECNIRCTQIKGE